MPVWKWGVVCAVAVCFVQVAQVESRPRDFAYNDRHLSEGAQRLNSAWFCEGDNVMNWVAGVEAVGDFLLEVEPDLTPFARRQQAAGCGRFFVDVVNPNVTLRQLYQMHEPCFTQLLRESGVLPPDLVEVTITALSTVVQQSVGGTQEAGASTTLAIDNIEAAIEAQISLFPAVHVPYLEMLQKEFTTNTFLSDFLGQEVIGGTYAVLGAFIEAVNDVEKKNAESDEDCGAPTYADALRHIALKLRGEDGWGTWLNFNVVQALRGHQEFAKQQAYVCDLLAHLLDLGASLSDQEGRTQLVKQAMAAAAEAGLQDVAEVAQHLILDDWLESGDVDLIVSNIFYSGVAVLAGGDNFDPDWIVMKIVSENHDLITEVNGGTAVTKHAFSNEIDRIAVILAQAVSPWAKNWLQVKKGTLFGGVAPPLDPVHAFRRFADAPTHSSFFEFIRVFGVYAKDLQHHLAEDSPVPDEFLDAVVAICTEFAENWLAASEAGRPNYDGILDLFNKLRWGTGVPEVIRAFRVREEALLRFVCHCVDYSLLSADPVLKRGRCVPMLLRTREFTAVHIGSDSLFLNLELAHADMVFGDTDVDAEGLLFVEKVAVAEDELAAAICEFSESLDFTSTGAPNFGWDSNPVAELLREVDELWTPLLSKAVVVANMIAASGAARGDIDISETAAFSVLLEESSKAPLCVTLSLITRTEFALSVIDRDVRNMRDELPHGLAPRGLAAASLTREPGVEGFFSTFEPYFTIEPGAGYFFGLAWAAKRGQLRNMEQLTKYVERVFCDPARAQEVASIRSWHDGGTMFCLFEFDGGKRMPAAVKSALKLTLCRGDGPLVCPIIELECNGVETLWGSCFEAGTELKRLNSAAVADLLLTDGRYREYREAFVTNGIDGDTLSIIAAEDLEELGVTRALHRKVLLKRIASLQSFGETASD